MPNTCGVSAADRADELFSIDAEARRRLIDLNSHTLRQARAKPLLDEIHSKIEAVSPLHCPPAYSARPASTRSRSGRSSLASWSIRNWS
jgi:hypothetical protein